MVPITSQLSSAVAPSAAPAPAASDRACPHCFSPLRLPALGAAVRCSVCRLHVAAGRSLSHGQAAAREGTMGAAAGNLVAEARREAETITGVDPATVAADLRRVALAVGVPVERMRMLDYQAAWESDRRLSSLSEVIAAHGGWKSARSAVQAAPPT